MHYKKTTFLLIYCCFVLGACSAKPDEKTTKNIALQYIKNMSPIEITTDKIKILKSYEKEGNRVMVLQVGGMLCDMPMIKTDKEWVARGISCNGPIFTPEELKAEKKKIFLKDHAEWMKKSNMEVPKSISEKTYYIGGRIEGDTITEQYRFKNKKRADYDNEDWNIAVEAYSGVDKELCDINKEFIENGVNYKNEHYTADNELIGIAEFNENTCKEYLKPASHFNSYYGPVSITPAR
jgi:hypothetical protein